jgi:cellulose biosynthesis protein BcsQ
MKGSILIWQQKGGVGKTTIACELITRLKYLPITNEQNSALFDFFKNPENQALLNETKNPVITITDEIPNDAIFKEGFVFDFGGFLDTKLGSAINHSSFLIIPLSLRHADVTMFFHSLDTLIPLVEKYNKKETIKIIIVINMIEKAHERFLDIIKSSISSTLIVYGFKERFKIFEIPKTEGLNNIFLDQMPIVRISETKRHLKRHFDPIALTFDSMVKFINL